MKSAAQILKSKSDQTVQSVAPSTSVFDALKPRQRKTSARFW